MRPTWHQRKRVGDAHEKRVARCLRQRGWTVAEWGQGTLPAPIRTAIVRSGSSWRYFPDLVAARGDFVVVIDAKDSMPTTTSRRYSISVDCVRFGLQFTAAFTVPYFYVFGDFGVLTPAEIMSYQFIGKTRGYYLVPATRARRPDDAFGVGKTSESPPVGDTGESAVDG